MPQQMPLWLRPAMLGAGVALLVAGCDRSSEKAGPSAPSATTQASPPAIPLPIVSPLPPLGRGELLAVFTDAASVAAAGSDPPPDAQALVGRRFSLRLPIGCSAATSGGAASWSSASLAADRRSIRLTARPEDWSRTEWIRELWDEAAPEAIEGFWIERPWTDSEQCPGQMPASLATEGSDSEPQSVAIAQFFDADSPRTFRRNARAYSHTVRVADPAVADRSYFLTLSGRIAAYPDGQPIHCRQERPDRRPVCVMSVELERVAFVDDSGGGALAEWRN